MLLSCEMAELFHFVRKWIFHKNVHHGAQNKFFQFFFQNLKIYYIEMVQFIFEGSRTNFSFWSKFAYVLVRTGVHLKLKLGQKKIKIKKNPNSQF